MSTSDVKTGIQLNASDFIPAVSSRQGASITPSGNNSLVAIQPGKGASSTEYDAQPSLESLKAEYEWDEAPADLNRWVETGEPKW